MPAANVAATVSTGCRRIRFLVSSKSSATASPPCVEEPIDRHRFRKQDFSSVGFTLMVKIVAIRSIRQAPADNTPENSFGFQVREPIPPNPSIDQLIFPVPQKKLSGEIFMTQQYLGVRRSTLPEFSALLLFAQHILAA